MGRVDILCWYCPTITNFIHKWSDDQTPGWEECDTVSYYRVDCSSIYNIYIQQSKVVGALETVHMYTATSRIARENMVTSSWHSPLLRFCALAIHRNVVHQRIVTSSAELLRTALSAKPNPAWWFNLTASGWTHLYNPNQPSPPETHSALKMC